MNPAVYSRKPGVPEALQRLKNSADFKLLVEVLEDRKATCAAQLQACEDNRQLAVYQGRARELADLLAFIQTPPAR